MMDKKCRNDGCFKNPSYVVAGSRKGEFCSQHATAELVSVDKSEYGNEGCFKRPSYVVAGSKEAEFCSQPATEMVARRRESVAAMAAQSGCCKVLRVAARRSTGPSKLRRGWLG